MECPVCREVRHRRYWRDIQWDACRADLGLAHHCKVCEDKIEPVRIAAWRERARIVAWQRVTTRLLTRSRIEPVRIAAWPRRARIFAWQRVVGRLLIYGLANDDSWGWARAHMDWWRRRGRALPHGELLEVRILATRGARALAEFAGQSTT